MDDITNIGYLIVGFVFMLLIEMAVDIGRSIIWTEEHDRNLREKLRAKFTSRKEPSKLNRFWIQKPFFNKRSIFGLIESLRQIRIR